MRSCKQCKRDHRHSIRSRGLTLKQRPYPAKCWHNEATALCAHHHPKAIALGAARRCAKIQRTPAWADRAAIAEVYRECAALNRSGNGKWHVDHIVPLRGKNVSGLHVENNLQILPARDNIRKSNRF